MESDIDKKVIAFIKKHHVMTVATINETAKPVTANLFYAYDIDNNQFIFTSSLTTIHGSNFAARSEVAANIVLETKNVGRIEGLQIEGVVRSVEGSELLRAKKIYLTKFPFAIFADLELWVLSPDFMKFTDNKLGFGKKLIWRK